MLMHLQAGTRSEVVDDRVCSWLASELSMMRKAIERQAGISHQPAVVGEGSPGFYSFAIMTAWNE